MKKTLLISLSIILIVFSGCQNDNRPFPKPKAYVRITIPQPQYITFDTSTLPFTFEYPDYGVVEPNTFEENSNWFNIDFGKYGYVLYLTYVPMRSAASLDTLINESDKMAYYSQQKRSSGVAAKDYINDSLKIYATIYNIKGSRVATPYQFIITDKEKNFLRASLNNIQQPNNDSLAPVLNRISKDLEHIVSTWRWKR
ncbi:MAG: hypothetical protein LBL74_08160 [Bacteroidales bacterium]|jgi:gliding motility-associated lipoprotein GldD|nr:hypothetical protein [Bacteroidales bacterium]